MKRYICATQYELLGYAVNDRGQYAKVFLDTSALSPQKALSNFRHQVHTNYPGWSLVEDEKYMNLRENLGSQYNRWPELPEGVEVVRI